VTATHESVLLVGQPNVGKSALFNRLTGRYVTVSNYPGTTVEIARGHSRLLGADVEVVDTPGLYSLLPITEDERVASDLLSAPGVRAVVHVVDAQNLDRMLGLALQLIETGLPVVVALNMYDEARESGLVIHAARLEEILGVPVVPTVSTTGEGVAELAARLRQAPPRSSLRTEYGSIIEDGMRGIASHLPQGPLSVRSEASLILQGDARARERLPTMLAL
jgi:ferrous iron transport protein B